MLKRLQLVGFKSFADKTDFDFSPGLTAIVGPNGSGKSNVVDAVKWILGEQSAKSLRGSEMADVIFNGSSSRRSLGLAEVTLTFDNTKRVLSQPYDEIQITRRVYRSGEGEYLINNQIARLKDIKDLFLGSGAGADAYCIIEQGRVDVLLQASTKERRTIFEEAAGISRFRARKVETIRKLERVDANLMRLRDITDEVEKQLRSVRLQAAKAQRFREHSQRLRDLRVGLSLREYHGLAGKLDEVTTALETLRRDLQQEVEQSEGRERALLEVEQRLTRLDDEVREGESRHLAVKQQIAADTSTLTHEGTISRELQADFERASAQLLELTLRSSTASAAYESAARELDEVEATTAASESELQRLDEELTATLSAITALQESLQTDKHDHIELMRQAGQLQNDVVTHKADLDNLTRSRDRLRQKSDLVADNLASLERRLADLSSAEEQLQDRITATRKTLAEMRQERERLSQQREETKRVAAEMRAARSGITSRIEVLEALVRSHEGVNNGVREVFTLLEQPDAGAWKTVLGLVADFFEVRREYAPLIDLALGEHAQHFIVRDPAQLKQALEQRGEAFSGRVSFYPLFHESSDTTARPNRLLETSAVARIRMPASSEGQPEHPGVVALAENVVTCTNPELQDLPRRLLSRTVIVRDLDAARELMAHTTGYRFVTLGGELLEADGTLTIGTHHAEAGLLSRKSELRELREELDDLARCLETTDSELTDLTSRIDRAERDESDVQQEVEVLSNQAADLHSRVVQHRERRDGLNEEVTLSRSEMDSLDREIQRFETLHTAARTAAEDATKRVQGLQARINATEDEIHREELQRQRKQDASMSARVALAQVGERLLSLRERVAQMEEDRARDERQRTEAETRLTDLQERTEESQRRMLSASSSLALRVWEKETSERSLSALQEERETLRRQRNEWSEQVQTRRQSYQARQQEVHSRDLAVRDMQHRLDTLTARLQEDYQLDLPALYKEQQAKAESSPPESSEPEPDPTAVQQEIDELRTKLSRLGSVNMDALEELQELELRASALQTQLDDLTAAKKALEDIINRINNDSRKLFGDTLSIIRTHFQELFRKLFGGGQADIVLEDENDILETGIEIIARPPGKELRSISLMSGGEKTMTAVALLLAIFRSKPSPFCILDEVDAALDEANIGRLAAVLREFLDLSQFIMITHSKRTMAAADVLYGVTMQESGISKRISVRFDDWPDDERPPQQEEQVA